jgi:site-specific recombinase XerD
MVLGISLAVGRLTLDCLETKPLLSAFLKSRRQGLSKRTIEFYETFLTKSASVIGLQVKGLDIQNFLNSLQCTNSGKHGYYRALRTFYNWLYCPKSGYKLNPQDNPIFYVDAPKLEKKILPSLTLEQVEYLINQVGSTRDKAIISLFADSGMRLHELISIKAGDINWNEMTITIWGKGNKQRKTPFTERSYRLLREVVASNGHGSNIWSLNYGGVETILKRLKDRTGLPCNAHTFRRTFASNLHRAGLDVEHIMRLGGWESLDMVLRYTRSVKFEDSLKLYRMINNH